MIKKTLGAIVFILFIFGAIKGIKAGAPDFKVFYHAGHLVQSGEFLKIYHDSPDRFLYAPGFAWLLSPISFFNYSGAMVLWFLIKLISFIYFIKFMSNRFGLMAALLGTLFFIRPLLIDLKYGQVNQIIVCLAAVSVLGLFLNQKPKIRVLEWVLFSFFAISKLFPAILLLIPFIPVYKRDYSLNMKYARYGVLLGVSSIFLVPLLSLGAHDFVNIHKEWIIALGAKGLPTETHNQSFLAFLIRVVSGVPTYARVVGPEFQTYGLKLIESMQTVKTLQAVFSLIVLGFVTGSMMSFLRFKNDKVAALLIAACFLPSYIIWKPYFIFGIPLAIVVFERVLRNRWKSQAIILFIIWVVFNFSSVNFIGPYATGWFEGLSLMLWLYFGLMFLAFRKPS